MNQGGRRERWRIRGSPSPCWRAAGIRLPGTITPDGLRRIAERYERHHLHLQVLDDGWRAEAIPGGGFGSDGCGQMTHCVHIAESAWLR